MNQSFLSVIGVIQNQGQVAHLRPWLEGLFPVLEDNFSDWEIVLVNNHCDADAMKAAVAPLPEALRKNIFQLNLSAHVDKNNAFLAGLDRANGDYTVLWEFDFVAQPQLIVTLFDATKQGKDIVYLRAKERKLPWHHKQLYRVFYFILKKYSRLQIDERAHLSRIVSRRALNSLLRLRENSHYLKALFSIVGYNTASIEVDTPLHLEAGTTFGEQFRQSLVAITSFTTFLRTVLLWIFLISSLISCVAVYNAVKVKLTNMDIFGTFHETSNGWASLVVLMCGFFTVTALMLYIMSIYLSNIYSEIKNRPLYIVESVSRY